MPTEPRGRGRPPKKLRKSNLLGNLFRAIRGELTHEQAAAKIDEPGDWWRSRERTGRATIADAQRIADAFAVDWVLGPKTVEVYPRGTVVLGRVE